jgi:hypothetical protein
MAAAMPTSPEPDPLDSKYIIRHSDKSTHGLKADQGRCLVCVSFSWVHVDVATCTYKLDDVLACPLVYIPRD